MKLIDLAKYRSEVGNTEFKKKFGFIDQWWNIIPAIGFIRGESVFEIGAIFSMYITNAIKKNGTEVKAVFLSKIFPDPINDDEIKTLFIGYAETIEDAERVTNEFLAGKTEDELDSLDYKVENEIPD
jgi:hypothetical protein